MDKKSNNSKIFFKPGYPHYGFPMRQIFKNLPLMQKMLHENFKGWFITLIGALFFFYGFLEVNILSALNEPLAKTFHADSAQLGLLSAWCFYSNVFFLIPAGLLLDRFSIRKLMLGNMALIVFATFILALSPNLIVASAARFISGFMMAFSLILCLKLASLVLPQHQLAFASSLIVSIGILGGAFANIGMNWLVATFHWRSAVFIIALIGAFLFVLFYLFIKIKHERHKKETIDIVKSIKEVALQPANWLIGFFIACINFPLAILGALFGIRYLSQVYHLSSKLSASIISFMFLGMIVGSPFFGWFSDYIKSRKIPMLVGLFFCCLFCSLLVFIYWSNTTFLYFLLFFIGFMSGAQVVGYPYIQENNPFRVSATALSFATMLSMAIGYGLGLPLIGWILNKGAHENIDGTIVYHSSAYLKAFSYLPLMVALGFAVTLFLKKSKLQTQK